MFACLPKQGQMCGADVLARSIVSALVTLIVYLVKEKETTTKTYMDDCILVNSFAEC